MGDLCIFKEFETYDMLTQLLLGDYRAIVGLKVERLAL